MTFGERIKQHRANAGYSMRVLADKAEINYSYICKIETLGFIPSIDIIYKLMRALDIGDEPLLTIAINTQLDRVKKKYETPTTVGS